MGIELKRGSAYLGAPEAVFEQCIRVPAEAPDGNYELVSRTLVVPVCRSAAPNSSWSLLLSVFLVAPCTPRFVFKVLEDVTPTEGHKLSNTVLKLRIFPEGAEPDAGKGKKGGKKKK